MKKILLIAAAVLSVTAANAKAWRINYDDNAKADFKTLAEATKYKDFQDGDVIYVEPGMHSGSESDNTISRPCTVIGAGWGFRHTTGDEMEVGSTCFTNDITISASDVTVKGIFTNRDIRVSGSAVKNVVIERNSARLIYGEGYSVTIKNNYVINNSPNYTEAVTTKARYSSIIGNIIVGYLTTTSGENINQVVVDHNTIIGGTCRMFTGTTYTISGWNATTHSFTNNIIINANCSEYVLESIQYSVPFYNNVFSVTPETVQAAEDEGNTTYTQLATEKHNQFVGATVANTFTCKTEGSVFDPAMYYQVLESSPAKTADSKGGECGAFGGDSPYVLHGFPQGVPYLYDVEVPQHPTNNELKVTFKVAGQNE